ncbi:DUF1223 domain-containing protein [Olivibacter domesticus]|uniref:DUF1223 domain-containing protein n=1 Tax=Olivibacter domesticus TaxID=407022 RepID=A0A1H7GFY4_OLID1|nr:DUF1223 domain-containing protein [Olivibacter domesticus]SEK37186.1 Protein of unknown function [Olivibacter domesticus]
MRSIKVIFSAAGLALVFIMVTAFIDMHYEKKIRNIQQPVDRNGFAVVELFTSEGCSSCPPADELMEKIQKENQNKQVYILAFHVDYWDHQGWKDRFSDHDFSLRQGQYANWMGLQTVYTPQVIVNGAVEMVGSEQGRVLQAITDGLNQAVTSSLTLHYEIKDGKLLIVYDSAKKDKKSELVLALVQRSASSRVKSGENSGRALSHVQIVRQLAHLRMEDKKTATFILPTDFDKSGWELIGFVQNEQNGQITDAARVSFDQ